MVRAAANLNILVCEADRSSSARLNRSDHPTSAADSSTRAV